MSQRHKVFVSYHHDNDQAYRERFERMMTLYTDSMVSRSVQIGDIDPNLMTETIRRKIRDEYLRDSTVTVVLVGAKTWQRKHVDWEVYSSIRETQYNPRSGLLGILLPSYPRTSPNEYLPFTIPPRLHDNVEAGFALLRNWSDSPSEVQQWIHEAYMLRNKVQPDNSRPMFANNRSGERWSA